MTPGTALRERNGALTEGPVPFLAAVGYWSMPTTEVPVPPACLKLTVTVW